MSLALCAEGMWVHPVGLILQEGCENHWPCVLSALLVLNLKPGARCGYAFVVHEAKSHENFWAYLQNQIRKKGISSTLL